MKLYITIDSTRNLKRNGNTAFYLIVSTVELFDTVTQFDLAEGFDLREDAISAVHVFPYARNELDQTLLPYYRLEQKHTIVQRHLEIFVFFFLPPSLESEFTERKKKEIRFGNFTLGF